MIASEAEMLDIQSSELFTCRSPNTLLKSEKFEQFLRIFNEHKSRETVQHDQFGYQNVTAEDIATDPRLAQEAYKFFGELEMRGSVKTISTLAQIVRVTYDRIQKSQQEHAAAEKRLIDAKEHLSQDF